jgi:signal transduction histidine kinase
MIRPFRFSLTFALLSSLATLLLLTWILLSIISFKTAQNDLLSQKNEEARILLSTFIGIIPPPYTLADLSGSPAAFINRLASEGDFAGLFVVDRHGKTVYARNDSRGLDQGLQETIKTGKESFSFSRDGNIIFRYAPLRDGSGTAGAVRLALSLAGEHERLNRSRQIFLAYFVLDFVLLLTIGSYLLSRIVISPIRKLLAATEQIAAGDYSHTVQVPGGAEIAELALSFNTMQSALRSKQEEAEAHMKSLEKANMELQAAREETIRSEKMASIGLLAAGTAHEIGTPLSAIIGYTGILLDELKDDEMKADYLKRIEHESARIDRIVRDLLNYARPSNAEFEQVDVSLILHETLEMLERQGIFKKVRTSIEVERELPTLYVDRHQLMQVLINLLINARDAMPGGGEIAVRAYTGELRINSQPGSAPMTMGRRKEDFRGAFRASFLSGRSFTNCVKIEVRDSGTGIDEENMGRIFDPFFSTKEPGKGTGLGLSISARIIDSFGGRMTVDSARGQGSRFIVWLPVMEDPADQK